MASTVVYATVAELKAQPDIVSNANDAVLSLLLSAASRVVDGMCRRKEDGFKAALTPTAREFVGTGQSYVYCDEALSIQTVESKTSRWDDYVVKGAGEWAGFAGDPRTPTTGIPPYHGVTLLGVGTSVPHLFADGRPDENDGTAPVFTCRITARWGYADEVPEMVKTATIILASRWFKRGQSAWADSMAMGDFGQLMYVKKLDPDVEALLTLSGLARPAYG